jgi:hypothetical protein
MENGKRKTSIPTCQFVAYSSQLPSPSLPSSLLSSLSVERNMLCALSSKDGKEEVGAWFDVCLANSRQRRSMIAPIVAYLIAPCCQERLSCLRIDASFTDRSIMANEIDKLEIALLVNVFKYFPLEIWS